jgi:alpha-1,6-mannosyltransferase
LQLGFIKVPRSTPPPAIKICDITQFYSAMSGGVRRYIQEKVEHLIEHTPHAHCLIIPSHRDAVTRMDRRCIFEIKSPRLIGSASYRVLLNRRKVLAAIQAERPDIIEVGDPYHSAWIGLSAARQHNIPIIAFYHSDYPRALERTIHKYAGRFLGAKLSPFIRHYVVDLYNRMSATIVSSDRIYNALDAIGVNNLKQITLGTNTAVFYPRHSRVRIFTELGLDPQTRLLLFVGRLAREKNVQSLFDMMGRLRHQAPRCHLILIGDGELRARVEARVPEAGDVTWLPFIDCSERLADYYSAADIFVHAGQSETFGLVALEAQACGTRVLGVRGGGLDEAVRFEDELIMARDASGAALAEAVMAIWTLGENAEDRARRFAKVQCHLSSRVTFDRLNQLYIGLARPGGVTTAAMEDHERQDSPLFAS